MKKVLSVMLFIGLFSCLSACGKKEIVVETSSDFGELQETTIESTEDEFAITNKDVPGYEVRETPENEKREIEQESMVERLNKEYQEEHREELEKESQDKKERTVYEEGLNEEVDVTELEDYHYGDIMANISNREYEDIEDVYEEIDDVYSQYSDEVKNKLKDLANENWDYWEKQHQKVDSQKSPWTEEELAENPNLIYYTREEVEAINEGLRKAGIPVD